MSDPTTKGAAEDGPPPQQQPERSLLDDTRYQMDSSHHSSRQNKADVGVDLLAATDESIDTDMLARSVAEAGRWAFGIMAADVWVLSDDSTRLLQPSGGFWIDPVWRLTEPSEALERLSDPTRDDYCHVSSLRPGEGLGGALWNDVHPGGPDGPMANLLGDMGRSKSVKRGTSTWGNRGSGFNDHDGGGDFGGGGGYGRAVVWRDVKGLANDPDQPYNEKVKLLAEAGFGLAAAVPFNVRGHRGIVVYLGRASADPEKLRSDLNEAYLRSATDVIGAVSALRKPRQACIEQRRSEARAAIKRAKLKIFAYLRTRQRRKDGTFPSITGYRPSLPMGAEVPMGDEEPGGAGEVEETGPLKGYSCSGALKKQGKNIKDHAVMWSRKIWGGGVLPPPVMPLYQSLFGTFFAFVSMVIILVINRYIIQQTGGEISIILGPIASLQTMGYGLTQAPAAQPRNMILANLISVPTAIILKYIYRPVRVWKSSLVVALTVGLQTSLGITHPPATAMAFLFAISTKPFYIDWENFGLVLIANVVVIGTDTVFNNLSQHRQYPTYWGHLPAWIYKKFVECTTKEEEDEEEKKRKELEASGKTL